MPAPTARPAATPVPPPAAEAAPSMDRDFVLRNHIVERYIGGRLPISGALDFERFCHEHPELIDEIALTDRIAAAVRLLDASGRAAPWEERAKRWWERLPVLIGSVLLALGLAAACLYLQSQVSGLERSVSSLQQRAVSQPLDPAKSTRAITLIPNRNGPSRTTMVTLGGHEAQMADLKLDLSWSQFTAFRVTIDRLDQGRVGVLHNLQRDSNGNLHLELNSTALGPGEYQLAIDGLNWRGEPEPQAWTTIAFAH